MIYLTCTMISRVDLAHYRVSHAKDWVSVDCGTRLINPKLYLFPLLIWSTESCYDMEFLLRKVSIDLPLIIPRFEKVGGGGVYWFTFVLCTVDIYFMICSFCKVSRPDININNLHRIVAVPLAFIANSLDYETFYVNSMSKNASTLAFNSPFLLNYSYTLHLKKKETKCPSMV